MRSLSGAGILLGTTFFAASLTPTLVPRSFLTQGVLAGACFAVGYGLGVLGRRLWAYLELPAWTGRLRLAFNTLVTCVCLGIALAFLWRSAEWQNSIRAVMGMEPVPSAHPVEVSAIALITFLALLALARLFGLVASLATRVVRRYVPRKIAAGIGIGLAALLLWSIVSNVLVQSAFRVLDASFRELDALLEPERPQPTDPQKTGSAASLVKWGELGRAGREFIASGPTAVEIGALTGREAVEPIRVYVGLGAAAMPRARAKLALEELKRAGGFSRSVLIVITPTGTGWIDPASMDSVDYLLHGDVASVAIQYSYLSSPLSLLAQPEYGSDAARALFLEVYGYWITLPKDSRPKLYLHGLSLGAMNSERSVQLFEIIDDPIDGALWSGPPFESRVWRSITDARNEDSPRWLPEFRDGRFVRFMNQDGATVPAEAPWGTMRVVYLQYASDQVVFFDIHDLYRRPEWIEPRGPDVSPALRWYPVVTMLQLALDMAVATTTPIGYGHVYAPGDYIDAWLAVTDVEDWSPEAVARLEQHLAGRAEEAAGDAETEEGAYDNRGG